MQKITWKPTQVQHKLTSEQPHSQTQQTDNLNNLEHNIFDNLNI